MAAPKSLKVKWGAKDIPIQTDVIKTVLDMKQMIYAETGVSPQNQKLLGLKLKPSKKGQIGNDTELDDLKLTENMKIMLIGSTDKEVEDVQQKPDGADDVIDDLDVDFEAVIPPHEQEVYQKKIESRVNSRELKQISPPRDGKKLLVLDIDYTLFDHRSTAETGAELMRPYLHEFLTSAYEDYDIIIWSATNMTWVEQKMKLLGVATNPNYRIFCYMDSSFMISVHLQGKGVVQVKPLAVVWRKFPDRWSEKNTIMFDDVRRNFIMNPQSGLRIRAFRKAHQNRGRDRELLKLSVYLRDIALLDDFTCLDHNDWERYHPKGRKHDSHGNTKE